MESRSAGVSASKRYFIVLLTNAIFSPLIDPLTSMTQIRSTLVLSPPSVLREIMAGMVWASFSFTMDLWALIEISILISFFSCLACYFKVSNLLAKIYVSSALLFFLGIYGWGMKGVVYVKFLKLLNGIYLCYWTKLKLGRGDCKVWVWEMKVMGIFGERMILSGKVLIWYSCWSWFETVSHCAYISDCWPIVV